MQVDNNEFNRVMARISTAQYLERDIFDRPVFIYVDSDGDEVGSITFCDGKPTDFTLCGWAEDYCRTLTEAA